MATKTPTPRITTSAISMLSILSERTPDGKFILENKRTVDAAPRRILVGKSKFFLDDVEDTDDGAQWWHYFKK